MQYVLECKAFFNVKGKLLRPRFYLTDQIVLKFFKLKFNNFKAEST